MRKICLSFFGVCLALISIFFPNHAQAWVASGSPLSYTSFASGIHYAAQIDLDLSGNVYVSGYQGFGGDGVAKYDSAGNLLTTFGAFGSTGVAVDPDGNILVVDYQGSNMEKYTNTGTPINIAGTDLDTQTYSSVYAVATDSSGNVYVANAGTNEIFKFNAALTKIATITGNSGSFNFPEVVAVDSSDNLYVLDSGNNRVQKFDPNGVWQLTVTGNGTAFSYPEAMTVDTNGNIYVGDSGNNRIQIFDTTGVFQQEITQANINASSPTLSYISGMGFIDPGTLFVGDNNRVFKINFDHTDPAVSINSLAGNITNDPSPSITGTVTDSTTVITNVEYSIDSGTYSVCLADDVLFDELYETYSCNISPDLDSGAHTIDVRGTDSKDNAFVSNYVFTVNLPTPDSYTYSWTRVFQGNSYEFGYSVHADNSGNLYIVGSFDDTVDFDPGMSIDNHTSVGGSDVFVTKYNADETYGWTKTIGGTSSDNGNAVTTDDSGNIYTTGYFSNTVDFDPGLGIDNHTSAGSYDIFLTKYNSDGTYGWTKTFGSIDPDMGNSVTSDESGSVYVAGYFASTADFDPSAGTDNHTSSGSNDIFLTKFNSDGTYVWTKTVGGIDTENISSVAIDSTGNIYTTGFFGSTVDFDPGIGTDNLVSAGGRDIFISKYNTDGSYGWTKKIGGTGFDFANSVTIDNSDKIIITGPFESTVDFDPGVGTDNHVSVSGYDFFITKLNPDGTYIWTKTAGGSGTDYGTGVSTDSSGNIYATGYYSSSIDFNPGTAVENRISAGSDAYITSFTSGGTYRWVHTIESDSGSDGYAITYDLTNNSVYATGDFGINVNFDPLGGNDNVTTDSNWSGWVMKLAEVDPTIIPLPPSPSSSTTSATSYPTTSTGVNTSCSALSPDSAPNIFQVVRFGNKASIFYTPLSSVVTSYQLMYGHTPNDERFAVTFPAIYASGILKYTVSYLVPSQTYYFWVRAMNTCSPGPWSNTFQSIGNTLSPTPTPTPQSTTEPESSDLSEPTQILELSTLPSLVQAELEIVDQLDLPIEGVEVVLTDKETQEIVSHGLTNTEGTVSIQGPVGEYLLNTTTHGVEQIQGMILAESTEKVTVTVKLPIKDLIVRQIESPVDASYLTKASVVMVAGNATIATVVGFFGLSQSMIMSLLQIYQNTSRSFWRLPFDYFAGLFKYLGIQFLTLLYPIFPALRKIKKTAGVAIDALTNQGVSKVYILAYSQSGNLKTDFSDEKGKYSFQDLPEDEYEIRAEKVGYIFPSALLTSPKTQHYQHVYLPGEKIPVKKNEAPFADLVLPLDPSAGVTRIQKLKYHLRKIRLPSYVAGFVIAIMAVVTNPNKFNQIVLALLSLYSLYQYRSQKLLG